MENFINIAISIYLLIPIFRLKFAPIMMFSLRQYIFSCKPFSFQGADVAFVRVVSPFVLIPFELCIMAEASCCYGPVCDMIPCLNLTIT